MRSSLIAMALVAAVVLAGIWHIKGAAAGPELQPALESAPTMADIEETALRTAAADGESAPTGMEEASGTLGQAGLVLDPRDGQAGLPEITDPRTGKPWAESAVYVVTMHGHFTSSGPVPRNAAVPTGTVLSMVIDAKSGFVVARSLSDTARDLHQVNPTVTKLGG